MEDNTSVEVLSAAKETLLRGLSEENQGLQSVPSIFFFFFNMQSSVSMYLVFHFYFWAFFLFIYFFQTLCPKLLESREAPPYRDVGANDDRAAFTVLQSYRKVFPELGYQPAVGNDKPESRLQEKHVWVPAVRVHLPGQLKSAALFLCSIVSRGVRPHSCLFHRLGLCHWFQLAPQEHSDDSHVCWNPKLSEPWEFSSIPIWSHEGEAPSYSDFIGVLPNPSRRYHCYSMSQYRCWGYKHVGSYIYHGILSPQVVVQPIIGWPAAAWTH